MFSTQEVLKIAREAEEATAGKAIHLQRRKQPISLEIEEDDAELPEIVYSDSESECIAVVRRRLN